MALIVQKFGGSSVADTQRLENVANIITDTYQAGNQVIVVVSAQGDTTDEFIEKAGQINPNPSRREMDVLMSAGEQISMALLAMAVEKRGIPVVSLTGWQVPIVTSSSYRMAKIKRVETERLQLELESNKIVIVAGFQGVNKYDDITTIGPRRIGYDRRRHRRSHARGPVPDLYRRGRRIQRRSAHRAHRAEARRDHL